MRDHSRRSLARPLQPASRLSCNDALEQSINFIYFPFSFQKKYLTQLGKYLGDNISRTVMTHDALKMWDYLWRETDFTQRWKDYAPVLRLARGVNAMQFGISPGEFGGINRPLFELFAELPVLSEVEKDMQNIFIPQAIRLETQNDFRGLDSRVKRMFPIWRDGERLYQDFNDQIGRVPGQGVDGGVFGSAHLSATGQIDRGWVEFRDLREGAKSRLRVTSFSSISGALSSDNPTAVAFQKWYREEEEALSAKYPSWAKDRTRAAQSAVSRQSGLNEIVREENPTAAEAAVQEYQKLLDRYNRSLGRVGISLSADPESVPPAMFVAMRQAAINIGAKTPGFFPLYDDYYFRLFGPITETIR